MDDHKTIEKLGPTDWDVAEASVYLAGPSGKFITGETLTVDGGGQLWGETWATGKPEYLRSEE
jgi:citronellol/citronellal dehydrogenase